MDTECMNRCYLISFRCNSTLVSTVVLCTWASCMKLAGYYAVGKFCTPPQTESVVLLPPIQISCLLHFPSARLKFSQTIHKGTLLQVNKCTKVYSVSLRMDPVCMRVFHQLKKCNVFCLYEHCQHHKVVETQQQFLVVHHISWDEISSLKFVCKDC